VRTSNGVTIQFLDVNMYPINCYLSTFMNITNYSSCFYVASSYGIFPSFSDAQIYTQRFIQALKSMTNDADWRVIRSHNPIFTVTGGANEQADFFNIEVDGTNTILDLIKSVNINLFLSSHNHFGQIQLFPYTDINTLKTEFGNQAYQIGVNSAYNNDGTVCTPDPVTGLCKYSCYYNDKFFGGWQETNNCNAIPSSLTIKHSPTSPANLLVLLVGFSGRAFDLVESDQRTAATVIYDRGAQAQGFGGVNIMFNKTTLNATFFSGTSPSFSLITTLSNVGVDVYPVLNAYSNQKITGDLRNATQNFNYSAYNYTISGTFLQKSVLNFLLIGFIILLF